MFKTKKYLIRCIKLVRLFTEMSFIKFNAFVNDWQKVSKLSVKENQTKDKTIVIEDFLFFIEQFNQILKSQATNLSDNILPKFEHFIQKWKAIPSPVNTPNEKPIITISPNDMFNFCSGFSQLYKQYRATGYEINIWDVSGIKNDEVKHCQVLKWLLDQHESHGLDMAFFQFFVSHFNWQWVNIENNNCSIKTEITYETLPSCQDDNSEKSNNTSNSRVDIQIENEKFFLIIEVKINANETNDQIMRYCNIAEKICSHNQQQKEWKIIYLTKDGSKPKNCQESDKEKFEYYLKDKIICLKWRDIARAIDKFNKPQQINPFMSHLLHQYSQYIYRNF